MQRLYAKEKQKAMVFGTLHEWSSEICRLRDKLGRLTFRTPLSSTMAQAGLDPKRRFDAQLQKDTDYRQFLSAMSRLTNPDDQESLMHLIETEQPELTSNDARVEINLLALKPRTFAKAKEFLKTRLKIQNLDYRGFWE
jgi:hypothetical protein